MTVKNEDLTFEDIFRASVTTKMTSVCDGRPSFRHLCHLSCFAVRDVRDCHNSVPVICIAFCADACSLKANQSVCTHEMSMVWFVIIIIFQTLVTIQRRERIITVLWVLVYCNSTRTVYTDVTLCSEQETKLFRNWLWEHSRH